MAAEDSTSRTELHMFTTREPARGLCRLFPPATYAELWFGLALLFLSLASAAWVYKCRAEALNLEQDSVNVDGEVVRLWVINDVKNRPHFHVEYEYHAPAQADSVFRHEVELNEKQFAKLKQRGPIAVKVCRTNAANHQVVGQPPRVFSSTAAMLFCLGILALLALAGIINLLWWWISHGKSPPAQVVVLVAANVHRST